MYRSQLQTKMESNFANSLICITHSRMNADPATEMHNAQNYTVA